MNGRWIVQQDAHCEDACAILTFLLEEFTRLFGRDIMFNEDCIVYGSSGNLVEMALWGGMGLLCMDMQRGTLRSPPNRVPGHVLRTAQGPSVRMCAPCPVVEKKHHGLDDRSSNLL